MKINTKETIKDLAGKDIPNGKEGLFSVGLAISNILSDAKHGGKMKLYILAQKFFTDTVVELDDADLTLVKESIDKTELYNNLVNGQLLQILSQSTEKSPKE